MSNEVRFKVEVRLRAERTVLRKETLGTFKRQEDAEVYFDYVKQRAK